MSSPRFIRVLIWTAVMLLIVHFSLVLVYSFREFVPQKAQHIADRYVVPCFHQNWKLFAPDLPKYNCELEYRFAMQGGWSAWDDVSKHSGYDKRSKVEVVEQGFNSALSWQIINNYYSAEGRPQFDRLVASRAYADALFMTLKLHQLHCGQKADSVQMRLNFRFTPERGKARSYQTSYLEFPVYIENQNH